MTYLAEILADTPTLALLMQDASGNAADSSGNSHTGTVSGATATYHVAGPGVALPYGITLAGTAIITVADHADLDLGNGPFSIEFWQKKGSGTFQADVMIKGVPTSGYYMYWSSGNQLRLARTDGLANIQNNAADTDTGWHHWVFTRASGADGLVWRDGVDVTAGSNSVTFTDNANNLVIGDADDSGFGTISGLAIYKSQLNGTRVAAHFAAASAAAVTATDPDFIGGGFFL